MPHDEPDPPQRSLIGSRSELQAGMLELIERVQRQLRCAAADLSVLALEAPPLAAALRRVLLADRASRVHLLVDDLRWLDTMAPRLRSLQRDFPHALLIRCADAQDAVGTDVVAIADGRDALQLQPIAAITGELWRNNAPYVQPLAAAFERRWHNAAHNQPVTVLGL